MKAGIDVERPLGRGPPHRFQIVFERAGRLSRIDAVAGGECGPYGIARRGVVASGADGHLEPGTRTESEAPEPAVGRGRRERAGEEYVRAVRHGYAVGGQVEFQRGHGQGGHEVRYRLSPGSGLPIADHASVSVWRPPSTHKHGPAGNPGPKTPSTAADPSAQRGSDGQLQRLDGKRHGPRVGILEDPFRVADEVRPAECGPISGLDEPDGGSALTHGFRGRAPTRVSKSSRERRTSGSEPACLMRPASWASVTRTRRMGNGSLRTWGDRPARARGSAARSDRPREGRGGREGGKQQAGDAEHHRERPLKEACRLVAVAGLRHHVRSRPDLRTLGQSLPC